MTNPDAEKTARRFRLGRTLWRLSALCFGLAALALIGAALLGPSIGRYAGQIGVMISFCALCLIMARTCDKSSPDKT